MALRSMTGYGTATAESGGYACTVEIRTVNARFREVKIRSPLPTLAERGVKKLLEASLGRGRVEVSIHLRQEQDQETEVDPARLLSVTSALRTVADGLTERGLVVAPIDPAAVLKLVGASTAQAPSEEEDAQRVALASDVLKQALAGLVRMREDEGAALQRELEGLAATVEEHRARLVALTQGQAAARMARYAARLEELCASLTTRPDADRVEQEVALLAARADVTEELARIESHLEQCRALLGEPAAVGQGKRLDFLCQEFVREFSTLGAKVDAHEGKAEVIAAKATLERIREQVQNVE